MKPAENLKIVLVNTPDSGLGAGFEDHLVASGHTIAGRCLRDDELLAAVDGCKPDLLVICAALPVDGLLSAMEAISDRGTCPVIFYSASSAPADIRSIVSAGANAIAAGSGRHTEFHTLVDVAFAEFKKTSALRRERDAAVAKLAERKLVERAKGIIMKERNLGEDEAYRLLRKLAMDRSEPLIQLATKVIEASRLLK